jgi:hypothetical protein
VRFEVDVLNYITSYERKQKTMQFYYFCNCKPTTCSKVCPHWLSVKSKWWMIFQFKLVNLKCLKYYFFGKI